MTAATSSPASVPGAFDLTFQRVVPVTAAQLWQGWTHAPTLMRWFTPAPWKTIDAEIDPRPGGIFRTVMRGPNGETGGGGVGCVLDAVPHERFVWTTALGPGYTPNAVPDGGFHFTGILEFLPAPSDAPRGSTLYRATGRHATKESADQHAAMGFEVGWGLALDQLVALFV
ncbi:MAG: SRPBCC domain-containing protein [Ilumatobacteraceae bacterium]